MTAESSLLKLLRINVVLEDTTHVTRDREISTDAAEKNPDRAAQSVIVIPLEIVTVSVSVYVIRIVDELEKVMTPYAPANELTE